MVKARRDQPEVVCDPHETHEQQHIHSYEQTPFTNRQNDSINELEALMNKLKCADEQQSRLHSGVLFRHSIFNASAQTIHLTNTDVNDKGLYSEATML